MPAASLVQEREPQIPSYNSNSIENVADSIGPSVSSKILSKTNKYPSIQLNSRALATIGIKKVYYLLNSDIKTYIFN